MGYFEGLAGAAFKKGRGGETLYYPWGVLGKGRVLPDDATEHRARAFLIRYYKISLPVSIVVAVLLGWTWALAVGLVAALWFHVAVKRLVGHLPYGNERLTLREGYRNSAALHRASTLWLLLLVSALLAVGAVFLATMAKTQAGRHVALSGMAVAALCAWAIGYMLKAKRDFRRGIGPTPAALPPQMQDLGAGSPRVRPWVIVRTVLLVAIALVMLTVAGYVYGNRDRLFPAKDAVVVYGRERCAITQMVRQGLESKGIPYLFADADIRAIDDELWHKLGPRFKPRRVTFPVVHVAGRMLVTPTVDEVAQALARQQAMAAPDKSARDYRTLLSGAEWGPPSKHED